MAKNRNSKKSKRNDSAAMDIVSDHTVAGLPQAMDTSESAPSHPHSAFSIKMKKRVQMKRSKNVRKMKAIEKGVSLSEKISQKVLKNDCKTRRIQSAKKLYD